MLNNILSDKKSKKHIIDIVLSLFFKSGAILFSFFLIPLFLKYLDHTTYGIWLTIFSVVSWISLLDGGLGNGLKNKLSVSLANNNIIEAKSYVSTTYLGLTVIMLLISIILIISLAFVDYSELFNAPLYLSNQVNITFIIVLVLFCVRFIADLLISVLLAKQKTAIVNFISFIINAIIFIVCYFILPCLKQNKLIIIGIVLSIIPIIVTLIFSFFFYNYRFLNIKPSLRYFQIKHLKGLLSLGYKFFVIQIAVVLVFSTDNLIITRLLGPDYVTTYNISFKLFSLFTLGWSIVLMPYWTAFTEAIEKGDLDWIKKTVKFLEKLWLILALIIILITFFIDRIYFLWVGNDISIPFKLSVAMAVFVLITTLTNIYVYVINSTGKLRLQFLSSIFVGIINIPLSILMVKKFNLGLSGVMIATSICLSIGMFFSFIQYKKIITNSDFGIWSK